MKGRVIKYVQDKGFGFVKDENNESRFFHLSNVNGIDEISVGKLVEFSPAKNEKGLICLDINVISSKKHVENNQKPKFITIGNNNIKISNIKEFGISIGNKIKAAKVPIYRENPDHKNGGFLKKLLRSKYIGTESYTEIPYKDLTLFEGEYILPYHMVRDSSNSVKKVNLQLSLKKSKVKFVYWRYLYITTYQNDNYQFYEYEYEIDKTLSELQNTM